MTCLLCYLLSSSGWTSINPVCSVHPESHAPGPAEPVRLVQPWPDQLLNLVAFFFNFKKIVTFLKSTVYRGGSRNFRKGGGGGRKPNSGKGGRNSTFQCHFQSFSYKSLTNTPLKGGGGGRGPSGSSPKSAPGVYNNKSNIF